MISAQKVIDSSNDYYIQGVKAHAAYLFDRSVGIALTATNHKAIPGLLSRVFSRATSIRARIEIIHAITEVNALFLAYHIYETDRWCTGKQRADIFLNMLCDYTTEGMLTMVHHRDLDDWVFASLYPEHPWFESEDLTSYLGRVMWRRSYEYAHLLRLDLQNNLSPGERYAEFVRKISALTQDDWLYMSFQFTFVDFDIEFMNQASGLYQAIASDLANQ